MHTNTTSTEMPNKVRESDHSSLGPGFNAAFWPGRSPFEDAVPLEAPITDTKQPVFETPATSELSRPVSPHAPIDELGISIRASNALKRRPDVITVADLIRLVEAGELPEVRNIGVKSIAEIEDVLSRIRLTEPIGVERGVAQDQTTRLIAENQALRVRNADLLRQLNQLVVIQVSAVQRQLASGLLHKDALVFRKSVTDWLESVNSEEIGSVVSALSTILASSSNVCDELAYVFQNAAPRDVLGSTIKIWQYHPHPGRNRKGDEPDP